MTNNEAFELARKIAIEQLEETIEALRHVENIDKMYVLMFGCGQEAQWCRNAIDKLVSDRTAVAKECRRIYNISKEGS